MTATAGTSPLRVVHTVCSHDCPDSCGVRVTVNEEGRAIKVQDDPTHLDWAKLHPSGENVHVLTSERRTDLGSAATFYSTLVEVERV